MVLKNVRYSLSKVIDIKSMIAKTDRKYIIVVFVSDLYLYIISKQKQMHIISSYEFIRRNDNS